jgi:protein-disulfide isomerase
VKKADQHFWITTVILSVIGILLIVGLKTLLTAVKNDSDLRKEEISLSRDIVKKLSEVKQAISRMPTNFPGGADAGQRPPSPEPGSNRVEGVTAGDNQVKGNAKAPVLVVQFSDYECPFSKRFYKETLPQLEKNYISTGKVKLAYRDFPLAMHPGAMPAAVASRCAGKQNKYWEFFEKINSSETIDGPSIKAAAQSIKLNMKDFEGCMNDPGVMAKVKNDMAEGSKLGVSGTPAFFINGRFLPGAYPYEAFKQIIDEELAKNPK